MFGFRKYPKYGSIVQGFRRRWKVQLERLLGNEIIALTIAAQITARQMMPPDRTRLLEDAVSSLTMSAGVAEACGFRSSMDAASYFNKAVSEYIEVPSYEGWPRLFVARIAPETIPDHSIAVRILAGCVKFAVNAHLAMLLGQSEGRNV